VIFEDKIYYCRFCGSYNVEISGLEINGNLWSMCYNCGVDMTAVVEKTDKATNKTKKRDDLTFTKYA